VCVNKERSREPWLQRWGLRFPLFELNRNLAHAIDSLEPFPIMQSTVKAATVSDQRGFDPQ
jgi:hypothetical protein